QRGQGICRRDREQAEAVDRRRRGRPRRVAARSRPEVAPLRGRAGAAVSKNIGRDVKIYDFVNLYGCEIGDESKIGTFVEIQKGARIGRRVKISSHTFICEGVTIEDHVFVGHGVTFINDRYPRATTADGEMQTEKDWKVVP